MTTLACMQLGCFMLYCSLSFLFLLVLNVVLLRALLCKLNSWEAELIIRNKRWMGEWISGLENLTTVGSDLHDT